MTPALPRHEVPEEGDCFAMAVLRLTACLGSASAPMSTPISECTGNCVRILNEADTGRVQMVLHHNKNYLLLTEEQLIRLMHCEPVRDTLSVADTLAGLSAPEGRLDSSLGILAGTPQDAFRLPD